MNLFLNTAKSLQLQKLSLREKTYNDDTNDTFVAKDTNERRFLAYKARNKFLEEHEEEFDAIYDELVKVRTEMAIALGYKNYEN